MVTASQINEIVTKYASHQDANKFVLDFSEVSHNIHKNGTPEAIRLANEIESKLADLRGGFISKSIFIENLHDLIKPFANQYVVMALSCSGTVNRQAVPENQSQGEDVDETSIADGSARKESYGGNDSIG